jgi:hypothetical protein
MVRGRIFFFLLIATICLSFSPSSASAQRSTRVRSHINRKGTYVQPHRRMLPNRSRFDNWSTRLNRNPYTGKRGTHTPYVTRPRSGRR